MRTRSAADSDPLTYTYPRSLRELDDVRPRISPAIQGPCDVLAFVGALRPERRRRCIPVSVERRRQFPVTATWRMRLARFLHSLLQHPRRRDS